MPIHVQTPEGKEYVSTLLGTGKTSLFKKVSIRNLYKTKEKKDYWNEVFSNLCTNPWLDPYKETERGEE